MGGRYYLTGVQLGMLKAFAKLQKYEDILELLNKIEKDQFIGYEC